MQQNRLTSLTLGNDVISKMAIKNWILSSFFIFSPCVYTTVDVDSKSWFVS